MTSATVRDLRYDFPKVLNRLKLGEEVAITLRGKLVGTLVPAEPKEPQTAHWPDIKKRLQAAHGKKVFNPVASILKQRENER